MAVSRRTAAALETTLGPPLRRRAGGGWTIDLTDLPLFHGLSVLSRALGERLVEECHAERLTIDFERRLKPSEHPELVALGCAGVGIHAEREVVAHVPNDVEGFQHHLRAVLGTLQQARWRRHILPNDPNAAPRALVFQFVAGAGFEYRFVLDRVPAPPAGRRFFLRITVEDPRGRRLDLASLPHVVVDDLDDREYIAGSTRIAQTLRDMMQREAERGRRAHLERRKRGSFVFGQLERGGLGTLELVHLSWSEALAGWLGAVEPRRLDAVLKRVLLVLEDRLVRRTLGNGESITVVDGVVFIDTSQQGRVLNLAFDQPRRRVTVDGYLARMPELAADTARHAAARPLMGLSVLLIHHFTAETLGLVAALRTLGCDDLDILFVRYAGEVPNEYLDAVLDLDSSVRSYTLQNVQDPGAVEGRWVLGRQLSALDPVASVADRLLAAPTHYLESMVDVAVALFVRALERGRCILVVEDGGYLLPTLTRAAHAGVTVGALAATHGVAPVAPAVARLPLRAVLAERLVGSVEHTRNGFDRLAAAVPLLRPAYSIAISTLKVEREATEVAAGVLAAIEAVLHARGQVLSDRRTLVLGARGAIGSQLMRALGGGRVRAAVAGIDLRVRRPRDGEAATWRNLSTSIRRSIDLVIGVTGVSVLGRREIEELVLHGQVRTIYFASGSTKTVEFADVAAWVEGLMASRAPRVGGCPVSIEPQEVLDPQSGRLYGTAFTLRAGTGRAARETTLVFVANLTPVNFLFYGVPTEVMDAVMAQLLRTTVALVRDVASARPPAPGLYAIDRDIPDRTAMRTRGYDRHPGRRS
jgi:S-adenosylhomocysteine hydrolase